MSIAAERIERLFALAKQATADSNFDRSREYVRLARRIAERNRCGLPRAFKRFTCPRCAVALRPGVNARVRLQGGHVAIHCDCGAIKRYPYE